MSDQCTIALTQVLKDEYESFHGNPFPREYLTWAFYKDHLICPARFAIKLQYIRESDAPDTLETHLRKIVEAGAPDHLQDYIDRARQQSPDCIDKEFDELEVTARPDAPPDSLQEVIIAQLNALLGMQTLYKYFTDEIAEDALKGAGVAKTVKELDANFLQGQELLYVNRLLLEQAYPNDILTINNTLSGIYAHIHQMKRSAVCLSGGGIRSASFGLGVLQGLARYKLLDLFDYISTVSGGGYLGSWLSAWIHRHPRHIQGVIEDLANKQPKSKLDPEPEPIRHLRDYSNYLSPKLGFLSADTWTLVSTFFRNLLLNWLVLVPLIAAVLMIPRIGVPIVALPPDGKHWLLWGSFILGFTSAAAAIGYMGLHRPSNGSRTGQKNFLIGCLLPLFISAIALTSYWAWLCNLAGNDVALAGKDVEMVVSTLGHRLSGISYINSLVVFVIFGVLLHVAGAFWWAIVRFVQWVVAKATAKKNRPEPHRVSDPDQSAELKHSFGEAILVILTGAFGGWAVWLIAFKLFEPLRQQKPWFAMAYVSFASPLYLVVLLLVVTLFAGLSSRWTSDEDREWWARFGGWVLIGAAVWCIVTPLVIYGPVAFSYAKAPIASLGGLSGVITLMLGRSSKTATDEKGKEALKLSSTIRNYALKFAAPMFAAFIVIGISVLVTLLDRWLTDKISVGTTRDGKIINWDYFQHVPDISRRWHNGVFGHLAVVRDSPWWYVIALAVTFAIVGVAMGRFINTNKFSLHAMYRNRLIRAYLGASNDRRHPNMFTGFDENDNVQMHELWPNNKIDAQRKKLLHIVNMALNLVGGDKLAWQQRQAESFTVSPLHAGNSHLKYRRTEYPGDVSQKYYGGPRGISLGTAITISGAAASPNMGYHSSPFITFLLSLFNVRLGWWLGNTGGAGENTFHRDAPKISALSIIDETLGLTNDQNPYIYLSDGGHFENLGLYEMVLRRCHFIVVSDASQDQGCAFEDLGNAVRKIRIDLGVPIEFEKPLCIFARSEDEARNKKGRYCAIGRIIYSRVDTPASFENPNVAASAANDLLDGILIYIKPAFYENEPRDIYQYAKANQGFPHESTGDQFFSESQLESYRALGLHAIDTMLKEWKSPDQDFGRFYSATPTEYELISKHLASKYLIEPNNKLPELK